MLGIDKGPENFSAVARVDFLNKGKHIAAGEIIELSKNDFRYLHHYGRVAHATAENVAAVKREVAQKEALAKKAAAHADELTKTKLDLAAALAKIEELTAKK